MPRRGSWMAIAALAAQTAGCLAPRYPEVGANAPARCVVRASQYAFTTDFALEADHPLIQDLVGLRDSLFAALNLPPGRDVVRVVIFESRERYADFLRRNYPDLPGRRAFFIQQGPGSLVVFTWQGDNLREDLRHEVTHALLHSVLAEVPLWLDEGLAEYFEVGPSRADGNPRHIARLQQAAERGWQPDLRRLEALHDLGQMSAADYRESWLWVHYCLHRTPTTRRAILEHTAALAKGKRDSLLDRLTIIEKNPAEGVEQHLLGLAAGPFASTDADLLYRRHRYTPLEAVRRFMDGGR